MTTEKMEIQVEHFEFEDKVWRFQSARFDAFYSPRAMIGVHNHWQWFTARVCRENIQMETSLLFDYPCTIAELLMLTLLSHLIDISWSLLMSSALIQMFATWRALLARGSCQVGSPKYWLRLIRRLITSAFLERNWHLNRIFIFPANIHSADSKFSMQFLSVLNSIFYFWFLIGYELDNIKLQITKSLNQEVRLPNWTLVETGFHKESLSLWLALDNPESA